MEDWAIFWISIGNTSLYIIKDKWLKGIFSTQSFSWYQGCFSNNLHFSSKRSSLTNVTWLLLLSIAKVFTSLMCFLYFTVTGTTYILAMFFFLFWLIEALLKSSISVHLFDEFLLFSHHHFFLVHYFAFYTDNHGEQLDIGSYILYIWSFLCILWPLSLIHETIKSISRKNWVYYKNCQELHSICKFCISLLVPSEIVSLSFPSVLHISRKFG